MSQSATAHLTATRLLAKNTVLNFAGQALPLLAGLLIIPKLVHGLGVARFGVLTLAWSIIGYSSLFDLGLGRALTKLVAEKLGFSEEAELASLVWTALGLMLVTGTVGGIAMMAGSSWLARSALRVAPDLQHETVMAFGILALSIPIVVAASGLRGVLEAQQRFAIVTAVRLPLGVLTFLAPWLVLFLSRSLVAVVLALFAVRVLAFLALFVCVLWFMPSLRVRRNIKIFGVKGLLGFGGWMTVSNVVGPLMVNLDRFLIGAFISMAAVAYYATPYEMITKLWLVPVALTGVLFPAFSTLMQNRDRLRLLFDRGCNYVLLLLFIPCLLIVTFAHPGMRIWLGDAFASNSAPVLQLLCVGVFVNSISQIPFAFIQGVGRPDLTAKLHLCELPIYLIVVSWCIHTNGVNGAAVAWLLRVIVDGIALFSMAGRQLSSAVPSILRIGARVILCLFLFAGGMFASRWAKPIFAGTAIAVFCWLSWRFFLAQNERSLMTSRFKSFTIFSGSHANVSS